MSFISALACMLTILLIIIMIIIIIIATKTTTTTTTARTTTLSETPEAEGEVYRENPSPKRDSTDRDSVYRQRDPQKETEPRSTMVWNKQE